MLFSSVLLFFCNNTGHTQQPVVQRSHPLNENRRMQVNPAVGTLDIIAVRVEFSPDDNRLTSGNGTFGPGSIPYLENNPVSIDPLPHDRDYFEAHLTFARNYFNTVSGNRLSIDFQVLPDIFRLDQPMEFYSPTGEDFTLDKLAELARDTWRAVETNGGFNADTLDPETTAFIIFHAGVGRDIELIGTTLDKTPQDIPSLYLDRQTLAELLNEPDFAGFPINGGAFGIRNSMILPRTLSRRGEDITGNEFVLQLSLNGLLCASIGSHLGLPDLFNTRTGDSGIGRFGLMDGAGFFSYNGLFPPEPSAWEKLYLGWITPFEIDLDSGSPINLPAAALRQPSSVARYSLSSAEYFLVENRHRDIEENGQTLTIRRPDGSVIEQQFTNSDETFVFQREGFADLFEPGVVIDVENIDWSLPGGVDRGPDGEIGTADDRFLNGGMLIWHIDEGVIQNEIQNQAVNTDPNRRGVDLEEADGAQDIGRPSTAFTADRSNGSAFDFWWSGNNSSVISSQGDTTVIYENRFGPDTHPNNKSNSGGPSFFEFFDFSDNLAVASFRARRISEMGIASIELPADTIPGGDTFSMADDPYLRFYPLSLSLFRTSDDTFLVVPARNTVHSVQLNSNTDPLFDFQVSSPQQPYSNGPLIMGNKPSPSTSSINIEAWEWTGSSWQQAWTSTGSPNKGFLSSLDGQTLSLDFTRNRLRLVDGTALPDLDRPELQSLPLDGQFASLTPNTLTISESPVNLPVNTDQDRIYTGSLNLTVGKSVFYLFEEQSFSLLDPDAASPLRQLFSSENPEWPAFVDFDSDGRMDFLYIDRESNTVNGLHASGAALDYFPIEPPGDSKFTGTPLIADLEGDGQLDLLTVVQDSVSINIIAFGREGKIKPGFPLLVGSVTRLDNRPVHPILNGQTLYAVSHNGDLKAWRFPGMSDIRWGTRYGNNTTNKVSGRLATSSPPVTPSSILVEKETYNWPNPANDFTHIRYQTSAPGKIKVKIISMNGTVIYENTYDATGGSPEEQRISTANWGSGIYFARIKAEVNGQSAEKLVKIAVVH